MRRPLALIASVAVVALASVGCSQGQPVHLESKASASSSGLPANSSNDSRPTETPASLAEIDSCSLLNPEDLRVVGEYEEGVGRSVGTGRVCQWREVRSPETGQSMVLTVTIRENGGLDGVSDLGYGERSGRTEGTGRPVKQLGTEAGCLVAMAVGEGERVEVAASKLGSELTRDGICEMLGEVVEIIDPKLPLG